MILFLIIFLIFIIIINLYNYNNLELFTTTDFDNNCSDYCDVNNDKYIIKKNEELKSCNNEDNCINTKLLQLYKNCNDCLYDLIKRNSQ